MPDCPGDAGQFVGQGDRRLVVADALFEGDDPVLQPAECLAELGELLGAIEHGACAVNEQHAYIAVPAFADASKMPAVARAVLFRREAQPAGQVAAIAEVPGATCGGRECSGGQEADAGDAEQLLHCFGVAGMLCEDAFNGQRTGFELSDLVQ